MLLSLLFGVLFATASRLRSLNGGEINTAVQETGPRRQLRLPIDDLDFIDEDDVGLNEAQWYKPRTSRLKKHRSSTHSRLRRHSLSETMVADPEEKQKEGRNEGESDEKQNQKKDPESGDSILDKVKQKSEEKKAKDKEGGKPLSDKEKLEEKIKKLGDKLKAKTKLCEQKKCKEGKEETVECIQCKLSKSILKLDTQQNECELKCLNGEDNKKECQEGCFKKKAKALYKKMEKYLEKKKEIMNEQCDRKCKKTGEMGDVYTCWKCRMNEELTRVARCRHRCQHKVKEDQKGDCLPACIEAVEKNMDKLKEEDKKRQKKAARKSKRSKRKKEKSNEQSEDSSEEDEKKKQADGEKKNVNEGW